MNTKIKNDGGPAFPRTVTEFEYHHIADKWLANTYSMDGMTLRDYFAAKAMAGDWATQNEKYGTWRDDTSDEKLASRARLYYRMADAMLKARDE